MQIADQNQRAASRTAACSRKPGSGVLTSLRLTLNTQRTRGGQGRLFLTATNAPYPYWSPGLRR